MIGGAPERHRQAQAGETDVVEVEQACVFESEESR